MKNQLHNTEIDMIAEGRRVNYQPIDQIHCHEAIRYVENVVNCLYDICGANSITIMSHMSMRFDYKTPNVKPEVMLLYLANLQQAVFRMAHTYGLAQLLEPALEELHQSNLSAQHSDGYIHRDSNGIVLPETFARPNMLGVIRSHGSQPTLFEDPKPGEVIDDRDLPPSFD